MGRSHKVLLVALAVLNATAHASSEEPEKPASDAAAPPSLAYPNPSPYTVDEFIDKLLLLFNEDDGYVSKARFEGVFSAQLKHRRVDPDAVTMWSDSGKDWYFKTTLSQTSNTFHVPGNPESGGAIREFGISWTGESFRDLPKGQCVTAAHIRKRFLGTFWVMPAQWGAIPVAEAPKTIDPRQQCREHTVFCQPILGPDRNQNYFVTESGGRYPRIIVFTPGGDWADSCVTGMTVETRKPRIGDIDPL